MGAPSRPPALLGAAGQKGRERRCATPTGHRRRWVWGEKGGDDWVLGFEE